MSNNTIPLTEQIRLAESVWLEADKADQDAATTIAWLESQVGTNDKTRAKAEKDTAPEVYAQYLVDLAEAKIKKIATAGHAERTEKQLNILRELLQHASAATHLAAAEIAARTAQAYATLAAAPVRPVIHTNGVKRATVDESDVDQLPF